MSNRERWSAYIMIGGNFKFYLRRHMTTTEIIAWIRKHCKIIGTNYFMCGTEVFCECK